MSINLGGFPLNKKQLIMENAVFLFAEQGFEQTSIQQITDRAGISKGAFYLSFKSKDELIISLIEYFMNSLLIDIELVVNSNEENKVKAYLSTLFTSVKKNAFFAKVLLNEKPACFHPIILEKIHLYYALITEALVTILKEHYPNLKEELLPELIFLFQSFTACYGKVFFHETREVNIELLVLNVYEKIDILANYMSISFMNYQDIMLGLKTDITKEQLLEEINKQLLKVEDKDLLEILSLLKNELNEPTYPRHVTNGLISLLKDHVETTGVAILASYYLKGQK